MTRAALPPSHAPDPKEPQEVSRFEYNLLRVLRYFLGHFPGDQGLQLLRTPLAAPPCLSAAAVRLVEDGLSKGCVLFLVRAGAWRNDRYLREGTPTPGRVWERVPLPERRLAFSPHVLEFLIWATAERPHEAKATWDPPADRLTPADELFFAMAFDAFRADPELLAALRHKDAFRLNPLCWLVGPGDLAGEEEPAPPSFAGCFEGVRSAVLECLQPYLAERWVRSERAKGREGDWARMRHRGRAERAGLEAYLDAAEAAGRPDLGRFVLLANAAVLHADLTPAFWTGGLQEGGPPRLADRLETQRAALALPRQMARLERWQGEARLVGYFDDRYRASQMLKADWDAAGGDEIAARARRALEVLEPLRTTATDRN